MSYLKAVIDSKGRTPEEREQAREFIAKVNAEAKANWHDPEWRRQQAAVLTESIMEGFEFETFYDDIVEVERVGFDDRYILEEETGLSVFHIAPGGHIEASSMVSEKLEMPRDTLGFHVWEFEDKMENNYAKNAATLRNLAVRRLDFGINKALKDLIEAAIGSGHANFWEGAGLTAAAVDAAIDAVADESDGPISLVGRMPMVGQISGFTGFADEALEEIRARGRLGRYRGANVIKVMNYKDEWGVSFIPNDELYVIGGDAGKFVMYGGLKFKEYVELDNWYWHYLGRQDFGGVLHHTENVHRLHDTSL